jgi:hypothetical protein
MTGADRRFRGVSVRTDDELELRLDRVAVLLSSPEKRAKRAQAAKVALVRGLAALEAEMLIAKSSCDA